jgi:Lrp/AsnC family leucine-responsive transcriptional regulator
VDIAELDDIDRQIIGALSREARTTFVSLGARIGLSANATGERVRRLERLGVISGYHARIDPRALGRSLVALVDVRLAPTATPEAFERLLSGIAAVREQTFVTGRFDYQLLVACRDTADLDYVLRTLRADNGIAETETRVVLRGPIPNRRQPG